MAADGFFRVLLTVSVRPGAADDFERAWEAGHAAVAAQPANLDHTIARSTTDPDTLYVVSDWTDEESFRAFERSAEHLAHREQLHPYRAGGAMATMRVAPATAAAR